MVVNFCGDQILVDFIMLLIYDNYEGIIIHVFTNAWLLDTRISTCHGIV